MSRQLRTLLVGAVLCLLLAAGTFVVSVPYVVLGVGPTINTLGNDPDTGKPIIQVTGRQTNTVTGNLNLTTVSVSGGRTTVAAALRGWLASDEIVVPHDSVYPPGQSQQQVEQQNEQDFTTSQDSATAAAACELGYPKGFGIISVQSDSPNKDLLKPGDRFVSLAGRPVTDDTSLKSALASSSAGQRIATVVRRGGVDTTLSLTLQSAASGTATPRIGVSVGEGCLLPFQVDLALTGIGGPSAGLMFSLGIIDKIGPRNLTAGRFIAGTGEIDSTGAVRPIGGIALKMLGARKQGATVFLAPADNCSDVRGNIPSGLTVAKVSSLHEALVDLTMLAAGKAVPAC